MLDVLTAAVSLDVSPRLSIDGEDIGDVMFSNQQCERMADGAARSAACPKKRAA